VSSVTTVATAAKSITTALTSLASKIELEESQIRSGKVTISELSGSPTTSSARSFVDSFEAEFERTADTIKASERFIESNARAILLSADALARKVDCSVKRDEATIHDFRLKAKELAEQALQIKVQTVSKLITTCSK
jgi:hypothetical protein